MVLGAPSAAKAVIDFDPIEADPGAVDQTRRLLSRVAAARGPEGLRQALHVTAGTPKTPKRFRLEAFSNGFESL